MNLIYTVAFGNEHFFTLAQECVRSLRLRGYEGRFVVITDKPWDFDGADTIVSPLDHKTLWKANIFRHVNCEDYEKILFIDSDIVALCNPEELFKLEGVRFPMEPLPLGVSGLNGAFLTAEEKRVHGYKNGVNAGTFMLPGKDAEAFLKAFEAGWIRYAWGDLPDYWPDNGKYKPQMSDQSALQAMIIRGEISVQFFPEKAISFPGLEPINSLEGVSFFHLCGPQHNAENKAKILAWMRQCETDPLAMCKEMQALSYKWNGGQSQMAQLYGAIGKLSEAVGCLLNDIKARDTQIHILETRISTLENEVLELP